jgi:uncharacterized protein (DUF736 family)
MIIGIFNPLGTGFKGVIQTLTLDAAVSFDPLPRAGEKSPDYRVTAGRAELGAAWKETSREGKPYLSVRLDDPSFPAPVSCRLIETTEGHRLMWTRETKR